MVSLHKVRVWGWGLADIRAQSLQDKSTRGRSSALKRTFEQTGKENYRLGKTETRQDPLSRVPTWDEGWQCKLKGSLLLN